MLELPDAFWKSILGTCWRTFAVFLVLAKRQNTVIYSGFVPLAWKSTSCKIPVFLPGAGQKTL